MPAGSFKMMFGGSPAIKRYQTIEQRTLGGRRYSFPQGNVLGGGSSVNVMAYLRGSRHDFARWNEAAGGTCWGWDDLLPHFRKQEGNQSLAGFAHGIDGPLKVSNQP